MNPTTEFFKYLPLIILIFVGLPLIAMGSNRRSPTYYQDCTVPAEAKVIKYDDRGDGELYMYDWWIVMEYEYQGKKYKSAVRIGEDPDWDWVKSVYPIGAVTTVYVDPDAPRRISTTKRG